MFTKNYFVQGNEGAMEAHSECETMESEYCSDENEKENDSESVKIKKMKRKRKKRTKKKSQVCLLNVQ